LTNFELTTTNDANKTTVAPKGELDLASVEQLAKEIERVVDIAGLEHLVVDLSDLEFIDSTGLRAIINIVQTCEARKTRLSIVRGQGQVESVFQLTGMEEHLPLVGPSDA
jgi:anti-anti-sigma factor